MKLSTALAACSLIALACNSTTNSPTMAPAVPSADAVPAQPPPAPAQPAIALPEIPEADPREPAIAAAVRELLQSEHLNARPIDDELSKRASKRFIDALDPAKLFLLQPQVDALAGHSDQLDDQLAAGDLQLGRLGGAVLAEQRQKVAGMVAALLDKPFDMATEEFLETNGEKRAYAKTDAELRDVWRRHLKRQVLERVFQMERELEKRAEAEAKSKADGDAKKKKKKKGKKAQADDDAKKKRTLKPLPATDEGRRDKARADMAGNYAGRFKRLSTPAPLESVEKFVNAIATVFDPHTHYLAPADQANFDIQMSGSLEGIGAVLTEDDHFIEIREVVPGGAAWRQGELEAGDLILAVKQAEGDAVDIADMRLSDVVKIIRGPKGTVVTLTVRKTDDRVADIEITRDVIVVEATYARGALLDLGKGFKPLGYVYLPGFYGNTRAGKGSPAQRNATGDVRALLERFAAKKVGGVVLDLRGNGGGLLSHARDITGLFIKQGPVVQVRGSRDRADILSDRDEKITFEGEVVVLTDRFSASGSEILAGALQDYGRALVVGTGPTHGKGTVQMLADLNRLVRYPGASLGVLKVTVQQFFLVDGESTQQRGVRPDIVLPDPASFVESGERYLDNAIPWSSVEPLPHTPWRAAPWQADKLATESAARQAQQEIFTAIAARGAYLTKRRDDTSVPLSATAWRAKREADDKALEALDPKLDEHAQRFEVQVVNYRPAKSLKKAGARADTGERLDKWRQALGRDPWVDEALHLLHDMAKAP